MPGTLSLVTGTIAVLNGLLLLSENGAKYRARVAAAIAENRDLTVEELDDLKQDAIDAIAKARED